MKIKTYYLILTIAAGFFCAVVRGQQEPPKADDKPFSFKQSHPAFAGIDKLYLIVLQYSDWPDKDDTLSQQLEAKIEEKLHQANIELDKPTIDNILTIPELRIYINMLSLEDSQQYVLHIRTALARAVCLKDEQKPVFKADIWQSVPSMLAVSEQDIPDKVTDLVAEQVDDFIDIYKATNQASTKSLYSDQNDSAASTNPTEQTEADVNSTQIEYSFVASSSSNVFHKLDCRWAQNISKENLIKYKSREEAINAGKRPCKTCNP